MLAIDFKAPVKVSVTITDDSDDDMADKEREININQIDNQQGEKKPQYFEANKSDQNYNTISPQRNVARKRNKESSPSADTAVKNSAKHTVITSYGETHIVAPPTNTGLPNDATNNTNQFLDNLLEQVSENLIRVMEFSQAQAQQNQNPPNRENKNLLYNLTYSTVVSIILPRENDILFVTRFLKDTLRICKEKNTVKITNEQQIFPFYMEMLEWTKNTQKSLQKCNFVNYKEPNQMTIIYKSTQSLAPSSYYSSLVPPVNKTVIAPSGQTTFRQAQQCFPRMTPSARNSYQRMKNMSQSPSSHMQQALTQAPRCDKFQRVSQHTGQFNPRNINAGFTAQSNIIEDRNRLSQASGDSTNQVQVQQSTFQDSYIQAITDRQHNMQWPPNRQPPPYTYCKPPKSINKERQPTQAVQMRTPTAQWHHQAEPQQPEVTRSVSTDSGIVSPLPYFSPSDAKNSYHLAEKGQATPLITQVTSLNPNVCYNNEDKCSVCFKITKLKCLCLEKYYCSFECQLSDWDNHRIKCSFVSQQSDWNNYRIKCSFEKNQDKPTH